jgi:hypothetical protein
VVESLPVWGLRFDRQHCKKTKQNQQQKSLLLLLYINPPLKLG